MSLTADLRDRAGTDIFGVADADAYGRKAPAGHRPADFMKEARSIVVVGMRMLDYPLDRLPDTRQEYTANFHVVNTELNRLLFDLGIYLQEQGHESLPVAYGEMPGWNLENRPNSLIRVVRSAVTMPRVRDAIAPSLWGNLSYRHMAVDAGLGELGVNNLLLTPEHGPRVRMVALITDADLETGTPLEDKLCKPEKCGFACVRACPAGALKEDGSGTDKPACLKYYLKLGTPGASGVRCGLCVAKCPVYRESFRRD